MGRLCDGYLHVAFELSVLGSDIKRNKWRETRTSNIYTWLSCYDVEALCFPITNTKYGNTMLKYGTIRMDVAYLGEVFLLPLTDTQYGRPDYQMSITERTGRLVFMDFRQ